MNKLCFIDVETTGLNANKHAIVELAYIIEINGEVKEKGLYQINSFSYKKPRIVDPDALAIHGYTEEDIKGFDDASEVFKQFKDMLNKYISIDEKLTFVGYNSPFDIKFVQGLFQDMGSVDYGRYFTYKDLDVFALLKYMVFMGYGADLVNHKLETVCKYESIELEAHNAMSDIEATHELHYKLTKHIKVV